ncbi:unnamed protein product [Rhizophagus irregularis]|nr:unnamed protein product [Rhizophagus irregularis]
MDSEHNSTDSDKWIQWIEDGISKCYINYYEYNEFQNIRRIGSGAFSNVYRANWKSSNTVVALKSFRNDSCVIEIVNELQLLHLTQFHANIIRFFGITKRKSNDNENDLNPDYLLILEYADNGILNGKRETPTPDTPIDYIKIYKKCWQDNPHNRPDMQQVFSELKLINSNISKAKTLSVINEDFFVIENNTVDSTNNSLTSSSNTNTLQAKIDELIEDYNNDMLTNDDKNYERIIEELLLLHENSIQKEINIENYVQIVKQR